MVTIETGITMENERITEILTTKTMEIGTIMEIGIGTITEIGIGTITEIGTEKIMEIGIDKIMEIGTKIIMEIGTEKIMEIGKIMEIETEKIMEIGTKIIMEIRGSIMIVPKEEGVRTILIVPKEEGVRTFKIVQKVGVVLGEGEEVATKITGEKIGETLVIGTMLTNKVADQIVTMQTMIGNIVGEEMGKITNVKIAVDVILKTSLGDRAVTDSRGMNQIHLSKKTPGIEAAMLRKDRHRGHLKNRHLSHTTPSLSQMMKNSVKWRNQNILHLLKEGRYKILMLLLLVKEGHLIRIGLVCLDRRYGYFSYTTCRSLFNSIMIL
jgi:hypothetical protein